MSEGSSGHVTKGIIHLRLDTFVNTQKAMREKFIAAIRNAATPDAYLLVLQNLVKVKLAEANYLRDTWYNGGTGGLWPTLQPVYPVLQQGLIKALEEAGPDLPLDSYWTPIGTQVEVIVVKSKSQVTRIIVTPPGPPPEQTRTKRVALWVVRRGAAEEAGEKKDQVVESIGGGVLVCQMKEWEPAT
ncbi:MAG: hypothetical protein ACRELZ_09605 [Candidatus Rokuibacteriota bacterium]